MEVILLERVEKLGQMGDVVRVKTGFARNYLLPNRKAIRSNKENMVLFESQRGKLEADNLQRRDDATVVAEKLDGLTVTVIRQAGESGQLYGSVTGRDVAQAVTDAGFNITRGQIRLDRPIKTLGIHKLRITLHPEVGATVSINVAKSEEEAATQRGETLEGGEVGSESILEKPAIDAALALADSVEAEADAVQGIVEDRVAKQLDNKRSTIDGEDHPEPPQETEDNEG